MWKCACVMCVMGRVSLKSAGLLSYTAYDSSVCEELRSYEPPGGRLELLLNPRLSQLEDKWPHLGK